jgi:hypothetical protein
MRRFMGVVSLVSALGLAFLAVVYQAPWWSRLIVFPPLWLAGIGLLSERAHKRALIMALALTILLTVLP